MRGVEISSQHPFIRGTTAAYICTVGVLMNLPPIFTAINHNNLLWRQPTNLENRRKQNRLKSTNHTEPTDMIS